MQISNLVLPGAQCLKWDVSVRADKSKLLKTAQLDTPIFSDKKVNNCNLSIIIEVPLSSNCPDRVIDVSASKKSQGVTAGDVFNAIHKALQEPVEGAEWKTSPDAKSILDAASQRCKAQGERFTEKPAVIDLFAGNTIFAGLTRRDNDKASGWALELKAKEK
ncbi:hypothetical protein EXIGLDRAFT_844136 [Exidia glandulosa HHB12029]|uniref:DUF6699 domain-containing protein n=1 Tax=Exidia glandulosa HHB12029 TaxID=1314781 RepID=A0A165C843_EXIGL|nr:hypothetical protein EXIGLDRAFT_844136 [Exidia glandulosa HHB12029]